MLRAQESATAALDYSDLTLSVVDGNTAVLSWKDNSRFEDGHTIMRYSYEYGSSRRRWRGKRLSRRRSVWRPEDETSLLLPTRRGHRLSSSWALRLRHRTHSPPPASIPLRSSPAAGASLPRTPARGRRTAAAWRSPGPTTRATRTASTSSARPTAPRARAASARRLRPGPGGQLHRWHDVLPLLSRL
jgi:hypothetical protein